MSCGVWRLCDDEIFPNQTTSLTWQLNLSVLFSHMLVSKAHLYLPFVVQLVEHSISTFSLSWVSHSGLINLGVKIRKTWTCFCIPESCFMTDDVSTGYGCCQKYELLVKQHHNITHHTFCFPVALFVHPCLLSKHLKSVHVPSVHETWEHTAEMEAFTGGWPCQWLRHPFAPPVPPVLSVCLTSYTFKTEITRAVCVSCCLLCECLYIYTFMLRKQAQTRPKMQDSTSPFWSIVGRINKSKSTLSFTKYNQHSLYSSKKTALCLL